VFSEEQEEHFATYLKAASDMFFGLTPLEFRTIAFEFAKKKGLKYPKIWDTNQLSGKDWLHGFLKRHPTLSVRKPVSTSLARISGFNKADVDAFFKILGDTLDFYKFGPESIFNMDETGVTTVSDTVNIIATKGVKLVGAAASAERGTLVTVVTAINATGNSIPPMFLFPRKKFYDHFLTDAPLGAIGVSNGSGWMDKTNFLRLLQHFKKHSKSSAASPVLLILDNHDSHISVAAIDYARGNGIVMLTLPPHSSHKLQPLDRSVFGPFKSKIRTLAQAWMRNNPGKAMSIYAIPGIVKNALPLAMKTKNIQAGFRCTGISPFDPTIFDELEFAPSSVVSATSTQEVTPQEAEIRGNPASPTTPELLTSLLPNPKAATRKATRKGRPKRKSCVLTDTPVLMKIQVEEKGTRGEAACFRRKEGQATHQKTKRTRGESHDSYHFKITQEG
jgi:hypothetical protein